MNKNVEIQFLGEVPTSICHFFCPSICPSCTISKIVHHVNKCVKWWYIQAFFFFFFFFFFIFWFLTKNNRKWKLAITSSCSISWEQYSILLWFLLHLCKMMNFWYTCEKWWYLHIFFSCFQNFYFLVVSGVKGQKMAQNDKKFYLSCFISQEPYIIWLSFMVHLCKMIISSRIFSFFQNFCFPGC